jgi:Zn-dependent protease with chaperone function
VIARRLAVWVGVAGVLAACEIRLGSCLGAGPCAGNLGMSGGWPALTIVGGTFLLALTAAAWTLRLTWVLARAGRDLRRIPQSTCPAGLSADLRRWGVERARILDLSAPTAFCAGAAWPTVYLSQGLLERLTGDELRAVLLHEGEHARVREPLRRAARMALAEVCFYAPVLRWWVGRRTQESELQADRAAISALGAAAVARALWAADGHNLAAGTAGFSEAIDLRVAQLLGDEVHLSKPRSSLLAMSMVGASFAFTTAWCLAQILHGLSGLVSPAL